ncbi:MAG: hypothetical protein LBB50_04195, partial [Oscillospiraceae bacterium]|nr:hypothetical protein [Oscillospiraceae bacterium]
MKRRMRLKAVVAALLAAALAVSLTGCSWFDEETVEEKKFVVLTPLPKNAASAQAYVEGTLLRGAAQAKSVNIETSYAISDVRTQNKTLNAVAKTVQNAVVAFLHNKQENAVPTPKNAPALFGALADDVLTIAVRDVLELQLA